MGITLAMLAGEVAEIKSQKMKPPETRSLKYSLAFRDARDGKDLRPPIVGVIADDVVKGDKAVRTITSAFGRAGIPPTIYVDTPEGRVEITSQDEWNKAVDAVWARHGDGALVLVGVHV